MVNLISALRNRILVSTNPTSNVHKSLELDLKLEKNSEDDFYRNQEWVWRNSISLAGMVPDVLGRIQEVLDAGAATAPPPFS